MGGSVIPNRFSRSSPHLCCTIKQRTALGESRRILPVHRYPMNCEELQVPSCREFVFFPKLIALKAAMRIRADTLGQVVDDFVCNRFAPSFFEHLPIGERQPTD